VSATLLLGVVWAFWHLPLLATDPGAVYDFLWLAEQGPRIVLSVLNIVGFAFLLTWMYNGTESVLLALLLHAGINTANSVLVPLPIEAITGESFMTVLITVDVAVWVVALLLIATTRGTLGYDTDDPSSWQ
jgi:membrane protease YdiL (CAAX protease family)